MNRADTFDDGHEPSSKTGLVIVLVVVALLLVAGALLLIFPNVLGLH